MDKPLRVAGDSSSQGWAVVTGASSGIGREFARELGRRGHKVLAVARRRERLEALATEAAKEGGSVAALAADLGTAEGLKLVITRLTSLAKIDLLVNNAGIATSRDFQSSSPEQELVVVRLNVDAVMTLTHAVMGEMLRRDRGAIVVAFNPSLTSRCTRQARPLCFPSPKPLLRRSKVQESEFYVPAPPKPR